MGDSRQLMKYESIRDVFKPYIKNLDLVFSCKIPVDRHEIKKNSRPIFMNKKTGKRFIGKNDSLVQAEQYLILRLRQEANRVGLRSQIKEPVIVSFLFYFRDEDYYYKNGKRKKRDMSNLYQMPEDCLVKAGILEDDSLIENHGHSWRLVSEGDQNMLEILIFRPKNKVSSDDVNVLMTKQLPTS